MFKKWFNFNYLIIMTNDENFLDDSDYNVQLKKLLTKLLKQGVSAMQLPNGDVKIFETKTYQTVYGWDNALKEIKIKSKRKLIE